MKSFCRSAMRCRIGRCAFAQHLNRIEFGEIQHISDPLRIANPQP